MTRNFGLRIGAGLLVGLALSQLATANIIAKFADPLPDGGGATMFQFQQGSHGLYGSWAGPPYISIETQGGTFAECKMHAYPMYVYSDGRVQGGQITFYDLNDVELFRFEFLDGFVDADGLRCGPQTNGSITFYYADGGVQMPPGLSEPLNGAWINFEFHNRKQGTRGPEWTASFSSGAIGLHGDLNCDGNINFADIDGFVQALSDPAGYATDNPFCAIENADIDGSGAVDFNDIDGFVDCLVNGGCTQ